MSFFGDQYDIHGGGPELIFPHHDSEIAIAESCSGKVPFVKYWLHTGLLNVDGEKMAKSLGNFWTVKDALNEYSPEVLRFFLVYAHYRSPIDFTKEQLEDAKKNYHRLLDAYNLIRHEYLKVLESTDNGPGDLTDIDKELDSIREECFKSFLSAMDDDFNTREAIANLFKLVTELNKRLSGAEKQRISPEVLKRLNDDFASYGSILGLFEQEQTYGKEGELLGQLVELLIEVRSDARKNKNYEVADRIRERLKSLNIIIEDSVKGTTWKFGTESS
jgi:cysteinyl-tRNA synthetase